MPVYCKIKKNKIKIIQVINFFNAVNSNCPHESLLVPFAILRLLFYVDAVEFIHALNYVASERKK